MRAARLEFCLVGDMLVPPSFDNSDAMSASSRGRRSQVGSELVPADDSASYSGRRPSPAYRLSEAHRKRQVLRTCTPAGLELVARCVWHQPVEGRASSVSLGFAAK